MPDKPLDEKITATKVLSVTGKTILFPLYLSGTWPFIEIEDNVYVPTQWINEKPGPMLEGPDTRWLFYPLLDVVRDDRGNPIQLPKIDQITRSNDIDFTAKNKATGIFNLQHTWRIPTKDDAYKVQWRLGGLGAQQLDLIEGVVLGKLNDLIDDVDWQVGQRLLPDGEVSKLIKKLNSEDPASNSIYSSYGINTLNLAISQPRPTGKTAETLQIRLKADETAYETDRMAKATQAAFKERYIPLSREMLGADASLESVNSLARDLYNADNAQQIASSGARPIIISSPIPWRAS